MAVIDQKRRHPRVSSPKGMHVAWQTGTQRDVSRMETMALGGLFICAPHPPPVGSTISILVDLPNGEWRARAIVRRSHPRVGMGVEFVHMKPEARAQLTQLLKPLLNEGPTAGSQFTPR